MKFHSKYYCILQKYIIILATFIILTTFDCKNVIAQTTVNESILTVEEQAWISQHPLLKATNQMAWPPLDFTKEDMPYGYSVDFLNLVAKKVGFKINYVNGYLPNELLGKLKRREIDIAQSILQSPVRDEYLDFTRPYLGLPMVYFGKTGAEAITSINDLYGKNIGSSLGAVASVVYAQQYPDLKITEYETTVEAFKGLVAGEIDVFVSILHIGNYIVNQYGLADITVIGETFYPDTGNEGNIRFAVRSDWPILTTILEKGMDAATDKELDAISEKWEIHSNYQLEEKGGLNLTEDEKNWLSKNKTIFVATGSTFAPIEFVEQNGEIKGISGAYLNMLSSKLGVNFKWAESHNWEEATAMIKSGEADMVSAGTPSEIRREYLNFTDSFLSVTNVIFGNEKGKIFGSMEGLVGYKLAQVKGYLITNTIKRDYPNIEIIEVDADIDALRLVSSGVADAYVSNIPTASYLIAEEGLTNIVAVGETPYKLDYTMGVSNRLPHLASAMKKAIESLTPMEKSEVARKWLTLEMEAKTDYDLLWKFIAIAAVIITIILIWVYSLRHEVNYRKIAQKNLIIAQEKAESAKVEAENANAAKSNFLANMSHEIRTPLNAIIGFSDAILMGVGGEISSSKHGEYLNDIKNSGEHLSTVINDILDLSKIEAGKWTLNEKIFSPDKNIKDSFKMIEPLAQKKQIQLQHDDVSSLEFFGDETAFKRIILNLLSNAVKFTKEKGNVRCLVSNENGVGVKIIIIDNGIGIPADRMDHVLNPFEQHQEGAELNQEGTGLGLPLVKNLIELHGGEFILSSEVNIGTQAIIFMPPYRVLN